MLIARFVSATCRIFKTNAEWCRTILRTLLSLDDVIEAEVEEKELAQLYKYHDNSFRHLLDNKLE